MFGKKKGQAAMEYLMTYGWAILAVVIVGGVLYYYGVFEPDLPDQGCPNAQIAVDGNAWEYSGEELRFVARNNAGQEITLTRAEVEEENAFAELDQSLGIGENSDQITITGLPEVEPGDSVSVDVVFTYDGALEDQTSSCNLMGEA